MQKNPTLTFREFAEQYGGIRKDLFYTMKKLITIKSIKENKLSYEEYKRYFKAKVSYRQFQELLKLAKQGITKESLSPAQWKYLELLIRKYNLKLSQKPKVILLSQNDNNINRMLIKMLLYKYNGRIDYKIWMNHIFAYLSSNGISIFENETITEWEVKIEQKNKLLFHSVLRSHPVFVRLKTDVTIFKDELEHYSELSLNHHNIIGFQELLQKFHVKSGEVMTKPVNFLMITRTYKVVMEYSL